MVIDTEWRDYDVIVVGSGGAGAHAAQAAVEAGARVLVVSKDPIGASDTKISGGIATVRESGADDDTEELLSENLKMAGADLPVQSITDAFARDSNSAYDSYRAQGLRPPSISSAIHHAHYRCHLADIPSAARSATGMPVSPSATPTGTSSSREVMAVTASTIWKTPGSLIW